MENGVSGFSYSVIYLGHFRIPPSHHVFELGLLFAVVVFQLDVEFLTVQNSGHSFVYKSVQPVAR